MKIAYIILGTFNSGGMERILSNKTNYLASCGYDVTIITTDQQDRESFFDFDPKIRHIDLGINFAHLADENFVKKTFHHLKKQKLYKKRLAEFFSHEGFDIVISMFGPEVHWLPSLKDGSRKIAEIHFSKYFRTQQRRGGLWALSDWYRSRLDERAIDKYDRFVVLTDEDKEYWGKRSNIEVIYNTCHIKPETVAHLQNRQAIAVGRLTFQKGYNYMVDAWSIVAAKHPDWMLNIYGGGEDVHEITTQIEKLDLTGKIIINDPTNVIEERMSDSSIYLLSSRYEGFGLVLIEAMACGVPCVAFECKCGPRDVITDGVDGFLVEEGNIEQMADRICELIENEQLRQQMGRAAVEKVATKFSQQTVMQQWIKLFNEITK